MNHEELCLVMVQNGSDVTLDMVDCDTELQFLCQKGGKLLGPHKMFYVSSG